MNLQFPVSWHIFAVAIIHVFLSVNYYDDERLSDFMDTVAKYALTMRQICNALISKNRFLVTGYFLRNRIMEIFYKECRCTYGTYRVNGEDKPVFYLQSHPSDVSPYEAGFDEVQYGLWCHFLDAAEYEKMEAFLNRHANE